jgi:hypothetical protein
MMDALDDAFREGYELGQYEIINERLSITEDLIIAYAKAVVEAGKKVLLAIRNSRFGNV